MLFLMLGLLSLVHIIFHFLSCKNHIKICFVIIWWTKTNCISTIWQKKSKTIFQNYFCIVNINILCAMCLKAIILLVILCSDIVHWTAKEWGNCPCIKFNQIKGLLYLLSHLNNIIVMLFSNICVMWFWLTMMPK